MEDTASDTTMYKKERKIESEGFQMLKIDRNRKRSEKTRNWQGENERERNRAIDGTKNQKDIGNGRKIEKERERKEVRE